MRCLLKRFSLFIFSFWLIFLAVGCDKKDACLDSGGCWDSVDSVCRKEESNAQQLCDRTSFSTKPYLEDFEALKTHISHSYANLEYLLRYYKIDPYELSQKTITKIKASTNDTQALDAIKAFVDTFKDGHFRLKKPETNQNLNDKKTTPEITASTSAKEACEAIGFTWDKKFDFKFPIQDPQVIDQGSGEFPYLVIKNKDEKLGIIRIADFRETVYPQTCIKAWDRYKTSFKNKCDEDCQEKFQYHFMRTALVENFYTSLEKVRNKKIDKLIIDLTNNGGGTDWVIDITAILTTKPLVCGRRGFIKHPHHAKNFKELLDDLKKNSPNDKKQISAMEKNLKVASELCDITPIWSEKGYKPTCSTVGYSSGETCKYGELKFKGKKKYNGKLFLLVNNNTASAAEDIVARHLDSKTATIIGDRTHGSGCGYMNGGIKFQLPNSGLEVKVPDCIRERADGTNEVVGIEPEIKMDMSKLNDPTFLGSLIEKVSQ